MSAIPAEERPPPPYAAKLIASPLKIGEAGTVQFPMVNHAVEIGWEPLTPLDALYRRGGEAGKFLSRCKLRAIRSHGGK